MKFLDVLIVGASKIDLRIHRGLVCNMIGFAVGYFS